MQKLSERYKADLQQIRNFGLSALADLTHVNDVEDDDQRMVQRLRLATALFNDLNPEDYPIVRFLFSEELKTKRDRKCERQYYNLRLAGFLLTRYKNPEDIWMLFEAHLLEDDFDIDYIMSIGRKSVFDYLNNVERHALKDKLKKKIGVSIEKSDYSTVRMFSWQDKQAELFDIFRLPHKDEITFALIVREPERICDLLPHWLEMQNKWTNDNALQYVGFAKGANDAPQEIKALELYLSFNNDSLKEEFKFRLAGLYFDEKRFKDCVRILKELMEETKDEELIEACVKKLHAVMSEAGKH